MINPNKFATTAAQEQGDSLWQGASTAQNFIDNRNNIQDAQDRSLPTPVPQENGSGLNFNGDPIKDNKTNFNNKVPGLKGMINEQSDKVSDYMENRNRDVLADKNMKQYKEAKNEKEKRKAIMDSERRGDEAINI
tara:strand:- start:1932 stop:2336 length:405 start_codon:yes stop_codon:yes gene_type:complete